MKKALVWTTMLVLILNSGVFAQSLGTAFTYQGKLNDGGSPANGMYDLEFKLYKGLTTGSQVGITRIKENVYVYDGYFTAPLDFEDMAFLGDPRYLEIGVRLYTSTGTFTTLIPRQLVSPTPYALYAEKSNWNYLEHIPADIADGDDRNIQFMAFEKTSIVSGVAQKNPQTIERGQGIQYLPRQTPDCREISHCRYGNVDPPVFRDRS